MVATTLEKIILLGLGLSLRVSYIRRTSEAFTMVEARRVKNITGKSTESTNPGSRELTETELTATEPAWDSPRASANR